MRITPTPADASISRARSIDDDLRDLRIDGYQIVFANRVALLPADLVDNDRALDA